MDLGIIFMYRSAAPRCYRLSLEFDTVDVYTAHEVKLDIQMRLDPFSEFLGSCLFSSVALFSLSLVGASFMNSFPRNCPNNYQLEKMFRGF